MKTVTLCGSMRFAREMQAIALNLEVNHGMNVLQCTYNPEGMVLSEIQANAIVQAHYRKIELFDGIYVVDIGGYIGQSAKQEIAYAQSLGKEVLFHSQHSKLPRKPKLSRQFCIISGRN